MLFGSAAQSTRSEQLCRYSLDLSVTHSLMQGQRRGCRVQGGKPARVQVVKDAVVVPEDHLAIRVEARVLPGFGSEELVVDFNLRLTAQATLHLL